MKTHCQHIRDASKAQDTANAMHMRGIITTSELVAESQYALNRANEHIIHKYCRGGCAHLFIEMSMLHARINAEVRMGNGRG